MYDGPDMPTTDLPEDHCGPEPVHAPLDVSRLAKIPGYEGVGYYPNAGKNVFANRTNSFPFDRDHLHHHHDRHHHYHHLYHHRRNRHGHDGQNCCIRFSFTTTVMMMIGHDHDDYRRHDRHKHRLHHPCIVAE